MTTTRFIPFGLEDDDVEEFFALSEELSHSTLKLVRNWVTENYSTFSAISGEVLLAYSSQAKVEVQAELSGTYGADSIGFFFPTTKELLGFIQFLLYLDSDGADVGMLEGMLWRGHSVWTLTKTDFLEPYRVTRRLPEGVAEAVQEVASRSEQAGVHLTKAWNSAYGLDEDPSVAYSSAIKAVETLACPLIAPGATLGRAIGKLYKEADDWSFVLTEPNPADRHPVVPVEVVASNMKMLWRGQVDRHGGDESKSRDLTIQEARAAVLLAATLVGWLNDGYLVKS